jgi:hypothetical protein
MITRRPSSSLLIAIAALAAFDAQAAFTDGVTTFDAYAVFAVAVAVVIVLLLWFAVSEDGGDEPTQRSVGGKQTGRAGFGERHARSGSDQRRATSRG